MAKTPRIARSPRSTTRRVALVAAPLLVLGVAACGDMTPPKDAVTAPPSAATDSATTDPMPTTGSDVSAVIGSWAARYGSARNEVTAALDALGSAAAGGDAAAVKKAAAAALVATTAAREVPTCPDDATESAYRAALDDLSASLSSLEASGDATKAQQVAAQAGEVFVPTDQALTAVYS